MQQRKKRPTAETNKRKHGADYYSRIAKLSQQSWIENGRKPRGIAALSPEKRHEISMQGHAARYAKD